MAQSNFSEALNLVNRWADLTDQVLLTQLELKGVGITQDLRQSIKEKVFERAGDIIQYDLSFMSRGRFRDMGAGRERKIESIESNRGILKARKPAPWFSRPFYGRLNALQGAIGYQVMEQAINAVVSNLQADGTEGR